MSEPSTAPVGPVVDGYARAIFTVAEAEGALERVEDELFQFARAVESSVQLRDRLIDPGVDTGAKLGVVADLLGDRTHPQTLAAVTFVVQSGRARQLPEIADAVVGLAAESRRHAVAEVRSAVPLSAEQRRGLAAALSRSVGRDVDLKVVVDPSVVGGIVARVGDTVIDGSVARRLERVRAELAGL